MKGPKVAVIVVAATIGFGGGYETGKYLSSTEGPSQSFNEDNQREESAVLAGIIGATLLGTTANELKEDEPGRRER